MVACARVCVHTLKSCVCACVRVCVCALGAGRQACVGLVRGRAGGGGVGGVVSNL